MQVLLKGKDGSVAIMTLVEGADIEDAVSKFKDSHPQGFYIDYFKFEGKLPKTREFRDAWAHNGKQVVIDSAKASSIHLRRVRKIRDAALEQLDKQHLRYMSSPDKIKEIEDKKQELRDLPVNVKGLEWPDLLERLI